MPVVAGALARGLEEPPAQERNVARAQAIVILAGGAYRSAPEWGGETVNSITLGRVHYGAALARRTQLPILITGGINGPGDATEAELMRRALEQVYGLRVRWVETRQPHHRGERRAVGRAAQGRRGPARAAGHRRRAHAARAPRVRTRRPRGHPRADHATGARAKVRGSSATTYPTPNRCAARATYCASGWPTRCIVCANDTAVKDAEERPMNTKKVLTAAEVATMAAAAAEEATRNRWAVTIAIVDDGGHLLHLQRLTAPRRSRATSPPRRHAPRPWAGARRACTRR